MTLPITLTEVKEKFKEWRATKSYGDEIPPVLWDMVFQLLSNSAYKGSFIMRELGLRIEQLRRKFPDHFGEPKRVPRPAKDKVFVQANLTSLISAQPCTSVITLERQNGVKLHLSTSTPEQFSSLVKLFLE